MSKRVPFYFVGVRAALTGALLVNLFHQMHGYVRLFTQHVNASQYGEAGQFFAQNTSIPMT